MALVRENFKTVENWLKRLEHSNTEIESDKIIALLVSTDLEQAHEVAERLRQRIADREVEVDGHSISVTISIGLAE